MSDVLATFVEAFDVEASVSICGEDVSSNITVYRKQYLFDVFVRVVEKKYGACTGVNIPVWLMRGYDVNPDNINSNGAVDVITNSAINIDSNNCKIIKNSVNKLLSIEFRECSIKINTGGIYNTTEEYLCLADNLSMSAPYSGARLGTLVNISTDGKVIAASAPTYNTGRGAVIIYRLNSSGTEWVEEKIITNPSWAPNSTRYGDGIALSGNGNVLALCSMTTSKTIIYRYNNGSWGTPSEISTVSHRLAISEDGNILAIGSGMNISVGPNMLKIYTYTNQSWTLIQTITIETSYTFVNNISMSSDGNVIVIGTRTETGTLYTLVYRKISQQWDLDTSDEKTLSSSGTTGTGYADDVWSVVSKDGNTIISSLNLKKIRIYTYTGPKVWSITQTIDTTIYNLNEAIVDHLYYPVSISPDGNKFVYGVPGNIGSERGSVHVFENTSGSWIKTNITYQKTSAYFNRSNQGISVAMSNKTIVTGAPKYSSPEGDGVVVIYCI